MKPLYLSGAVAPCVYLNKDIESAEVQCALESVTAAAAARADGSLEQRNGDGSAHPNQAEAVATQAHMQARAARARAHTQHVSPPACSQRPQKTNLPAACTMLSC